MTMRALLPLILLVFLAAPMAGTAQGADETLIATSDETRSVKLVEMRNGLASLTLVWPMGTQTPQNVDAIRAGLMSVLSGGTTSRTPEQIGIFVRQKGVRSEVWTIEDNLLLTVTAPNDVFPEVMVHLENLLLKSTYSDDWYARELRRLSRPVSSTTKNPSDVVNRLEQFLNYGPALAVDDGFGPRFRFGRPSQAILRSEDETVFARMQRLITRLPAKSSGTRFGSWLQQLVPQDPAGFTLPKGIIHFADPNSSETLLLLVSAQAFEDEIRQLGTNLLLDYIGSNQGSEMFRIIRQEMRASYDPASRFVIAGDKRALLVLSTTVEATEWPDILDRLRGIYQDVRQGNVEQDGLRIQLAQLQQFYENKLFFDAAWTVGHYLRAHPEGAVGNIQIPLFNAFGQIDLNDTIQSAEAHLPPFEDFLLVILGGGPAPSDVLGTNKICTLDKFEPLDRCLDTLPAAN